MKTFKFIPTTGTIALSILLLAGCEADETTLPTYDSTTKTTMSAAEQALCQQQFDSLPIEQISEAELAALVLMREEEFLARDVYQALYAKWNLPVFNNISKSEQQHTDAVKKLLDRYGLEDFAAGHQSGIFLQAELQELYNALTEKGLLSVTDALTVGATIEDLDIKDLLDLSTEVDNADILWVFGNLTKGSRNHLRSFVGQLRNRGEAYVPQFISEELFNEIMATPHERGCTGN